MEFKVEPAPEFSMNLLKMTGGPLFQRVWPVIKTISEFGMIGQVVARENNLVLSKPSSSQEPSIMLVNIPTDGFFDDSITLAYLTEVEFMKACVVYFVALDFSKNVSLEFILDEGYTRYMKLKAKRRSQ